MSTESGAEPLGITPARQFDTDGYLRAELKSIAGRKDADKRHSVTGALVTKRHRELINAHNLDVQHEKAGTPDAEIPPVALDISDAEVAQIKNLSGLTIEDEAMIAWNEELVKSIYQKVGASYPADEAGEIPQETTTLPLARLTNRFSYATANGEFVMTTSNPEVNATFEQLQAGTIPPSRLRVVTTVPADPYSNFVLQQVRVEGSNAKVHTFLKPSKPPTAV